MISILLNLVAPSAIAELTFESTSSFPELVDSLGKSHEIKTRNEFMAELRVDGNFFSDPRASKVLIGMKATPVIILKLVLI